LAKQQKDGSTSIYSVTSQAKIMLTLKRDAEHRSSWWEFAINLPYSKRDAYIKNKTKLHQHN